MKPIINMSLITVSILSLMILACAPKDKRFQSIKRIDKLKKTLDKPKGKGVDRTTVKVVDPRFPGKASQKVSTPATNRDLEGLLPSDMNPSGIKETEVVINFEKLLVGSLSDYDEELDLKVIVRLVDTTTIGQDSAPLQAELAAVKLDKITETITSVDLTGMSQLRIQRKAINDNLKKLMELNKTAEVAIELLIEQTMNTAGRSPKEDKFETSKVASSIVKLIEIKKDPKIVNAKSDVNSKEPDGEIVDGVDLQVSILSEGQYEITEGSLANNTNLICELSTDSNMFVEVKSKSLKIIDDVKTDTDLDFNNASTIREVVNSSIDQETKVENILTQNSSQDFDNLAILSLAKEECSQENSLLDGFSYVAELVFHNSTKETVTLQGCCVDATQELKLRVSTEEETTEETTEED